MLGTRAPPSWAAPLRSETGLSLIRDGSAHGRWRRSASCLDTSRRSAMACLPKRTFEVGRFGVSFASGKVLPHPLHLTSRPLDACSHLANSLVAESVLVTGAGCDANVQRATRRWSRVFEAWNGVVEGARTRDPQSTTAFHAQRSTSHLTPSPCTFAFPFPLRALAPQQEQPPRAQLGAARACFARARNLGLSVTRGGTRRPAPLK